MANDGARVVVGTSYEVLVLLYRQIQADHGLPALAETWSDVALPDELRPAADWFFRGDIALGMNVIPLAHAHQWHTMAELIAGVATIPPLDLAATMLRSPDATATDHSKRKRQLAHIFAGEHPRAGLLNSLHRERFDIEAAEHLLDDPARAAHEFTRLLKRYGQIAAGRDLDRPLAAASAAAQSLLATRPLEEAAARLIPQWRLQGLATFESVTLIPSMAMAPFLSARLTPTRQALIVYPVRSADQSSADELALALKTLAHPQRLEILRLINQAPITGHALARATGLTEATVHHHTSQLRAAGLVTSHRDANRVYLRAVPSALDRLFQQVHRAIHEPPSETT